MAAAEPEAHNAGLREECRQLCAEASEPLGVRKAPRLSLETVKSSYIPLGSAD